MEYNKPEELIQKYAVILEKLNIKKEKSCILVKQNSLKDELLNIDKNSGKHLLLTAIRLWESGNRYHKQKALELAGEQISKWFNGGKLKSDYYCPVSIKPVFRWRLFLRDVLNDCIDNEKMMNFALTYGEWYKNARNELPGIIKRCYTKLSEFDEEERNFDEIFNEKKWFDAKDAKAKIKFQDVFSVEPGFLINTVHSSKGCTYDSTLVISSERKDSYSGHWKEHWIQGDGEDKRVGYVASTRAKHLLVWGVPKLLEDRKLIESLGMRDGSVLL
ncbi:MAG: hypothetical protein GX754_07310 [Clostridiaceae bacterium]|nr:hypothetical protein [Clostridiaceae bacterium]